MTYEQILEMLGRIDQLNAEELQQLDDAIASLFNEASAVDPPTAESVAQMQQMTEARTTVDGEAQARQEAQAELERQAEELRQRFAGEQVDETPPAEGEEQPPAEGEEQPPAEGEQPPAEGEQPPAEGEEQPPAEAPVPEAVAASTPPAQRRPSPVPLVRLGNRAPAPVNRAGRRAGARRQGLTAAGDLPGVSAGQRLNSWRDLAPGMAEKIDATRGATGEWRVASLSWDYDDAHTLDGNGELNSDKIRTAQRDHSSRIDQVIASLSADPSRYNELTAAGGLCAPLAPYYELMTVSEATRPVRDSLVQFGATRGGISFITPPKLGDLDAAVTQWTIANDSAATAGTPTKPFVRVACGTPETVDLYAVPLGLEFGVIGARTFPEQVDANNVIGLATHARFAETLLLSAIDTASIAPAADTDTYGAARALLSVLEIMRSGMINRHRAPLNTKVRVILPAWARAVIRTDIARQLATDASESDGGALAVTDAMIDNWLAVRNIVATWHEDGGSGEKFGAQAASPTGLVKYPGNIKVRMFFDGSFLYLDGGRLDVGILRDSTLVSTNDYKTFFEVFEAVAFVGPEALSVTLTTAPSGASGGTVVAAAP